ncbi:hypothetical protein ACJ1_44830 [Pantoea sp. QMID1]|nr:hypothetical protein ACJ1_44830 [Pantoea sp. QMID1]
MGEINKLSHVGRREGAGEQRRPVAGRKKGVRKPWVIEMRTPSGVSSSYALLNILTCGGDCGIID